MWLNGLWQRLASFALLLWLCPALAQAAPWLELNFDSRRPAQQRWAADVKRYLAVLQQRNGSTLRISSRSVRAGGPRVLLWGSDGKSRGQGLGGARQAAEQVFVRLGQLDPGRFPCATAAPLLDVATEPAGAGVFVNGKLRGQTPLKLELSEGECRVQLQLDAYEPRERQLSLKAGEEVSWQEMLVAEPAFLRFESPNLPMQVSLDGQESVVTPFLVEVAAGNHTYRASAPGHHELEGSLQLEGGRMTSVQFTPLAVTLRVALHDLQAAGYEGNSYSFGRWDYYVVELDREELVQRLMEKLRPRTDFEISEKDPDLVMRVEVQASKEEVVGQAALFSGEGTTLFSCQAQRDMPFLTFDEEGSARLRSLEVVEELARQLLSEIPRHRERSQPPSDQSPGVRVIVEPP